MKYYINHCEITQNWTTWEVDADSYEEAVQKLNQTDMTTWMYPPP